MITAELLDFYFASRFESPEQRVRFVRQSTVVLRDLNVFVMLRCLGSPHGYVTRYSSAWLLRGCPSVDWPKWAQKELAYDREEQRQCADRIASALNHGQQAVFDEIVNAVESRPDDAHFFIQGPGGTGKTFLYRGLCAHYRSQGHIFLCVASSGIAALLLPGGRTAHSRFKIPLDSLTGESICPISKASPEAELFRHTRLIIWDEVPMQHKYCFEAVDRTLRDICDVDSIFGGIPTVFGGDFAQIMPVVRHGRRQDLVRANLQTSPLWSHISVRYLTENMRVRNAGPENRRFIQWLHDRHPNKQSPINQY
ncbi:hypothetical protein CDD83_83 [Cordyceps sp. RAO-2017]|nr:hypothetical protein CDD83_83 [Cordyceps sp. RAO-2017]